MSTTPKVPPAPLPPVPGAVSAHLKDEADAGMKSPITELFSLFLLKPALQSVYRNYKTWRLIGRTISKLNNDKKTPQERLAKTFDYLIRKDTENLRVRLYFSKKMNLPGVMADLTQKLRGDQPLDSIKMATAFLQMIRGRVSVRMGFSLIQLTCKVAFAVGAIFAVMTPLSWVGLSILGIAGAVSLIFCGINALFLSRNPLKKHAL